MQRHILFKSIQRRLYDFLLTRYGILFILGSLLLIVIFLLQLSDTIIEYRMAQLRHLANVITLKNTSILLSINYHYYPTLKPSQQINNEAIDVVYTWVNGSDEAHLEMVRKYRNENSSSVRKMLEVDEYLRLDESALPACFHKLCVPTNQVVVVVPQLDQISKKTVTSKHSVTIEQHPSKNVSVLYLSAQSQLPALNSLLLNSNNIRFQYKIYMAYYSIECSDGINCIQQPQNPAYIFKKRKSARQQSYYDRLSHINNQILINSLNNAPNVVPEPDFLPLPTFLNASLIYRLDYVHKPPVPTAFDGSDNTNLTKKGGSTSSSSSSSKSSQDGSYLTLIRLKTRLDEKMSYILHDSTNTTYDIYPASLVWDLGDSARDEVGAHRFQDNDELKFSLRSLEKHAPWVRRIYIVTNGQIPSWLDLSNPKIKLITHRDIFPNKSHLPTFSSPAIESHLHRIEGLSKRFLYFNDDTLLTSQIYPDDFYTESRGYRFRLAWVLPGCNQHCPQSWISDGYCDKACNVTECEWDGGDCDMSNRTSVRRTEFDAAREAFAQQSRHLFPEFYCSPGCSTSWLADKYCDNACNVRNCSFDMGDCGVDQYSKVYEVKLPHLSLNGHTISTPAQIISFYFNFTSPSSQIRIIKANYEENQLVRTVSIVNKFSIMTVLLMPESYRLRINQPELDSLTVHLSVNSSTQGLFNSTLIITLNSFNLTSDLPETIQTEHIVSTHVPITPPASSSSSNKKLIVINRIDLEPKKIMEKNIKSEILVPANYNNKIFRYLYANYHSYLTWSLNAGYLTPDGLVHKLNLLDAKIKSEFNSTMNHISDTELDLTLGQLLTDSEKSILVPKYLNESQSASLDSANAIVRFNKRKLLDTFADSLKYVNKLYNQLYGYAARKVPAHMPHFIDREIMESLQARFPVEFEKTSGSRFRQSTDMQFAFSYYYYIMSEIVEFNASQLFQELDLNSNSKLDPSELMLISLRMSDRPFTASDLVPNMASIVEMRSLHPELISAVHQCNFTENSLDLAAFLSCEPLLSALKPNLWLHDSKERLKYRFEMAGDEETRFIMIAGEPLDIEVKLANYMKEPRKFLCLNDNIDYRLINEAKRMQYLLKQFFETFFPLKSEFELVEGELKSTTAFFNKHEQDSKVTHYNLNWVYYCLLLGLLVVIVRIMVKRFKHRKNNVDSTIKISRQARQKRAKKEYKVSDAFRKRMGLEPEDDDDEDKESLIEESLSTSSSSIVLVNEREKGKSGNVSMRSAASTKKQSKKKPIISNI